MLLKLFTTLFVICGVLSISAATSVPTDPQDCPKICARNYNPLCATNGKVYKEFSSLCQLNVINCRLELVAVQKYIPTAMDWCSTELVDGLQHLLEKLGITDIDTPDCKQPCPLIYSPVCISNGQYRMVLNNECLMEAINCVLGDNIRTGFRVLKYDSC